MHKTNLLSCPLALEVHVEPHKKQLHVTLAYNFPTNHLPSLEKLAKGIEAKLGCDWLAVLFSRDIRFANHEVANIRSNSACFKVTVAVSQQHPDLLTHDYLV